MDGFKLNDAPDIFLGNSLIKYVYVKNVKVWDYKTPPVYTAPTVKTGLVFNGSSQALLNAGSTSHGTIQYSSDGSTWSTTIPTSINANNNITVYWRLVGDNRHYDISSTPLTASIAKKALTITAKEQSIQWGNSIATGTGQVTTSGLVSGDQLTGITLTPSTSDLTTTGIITPSSATTTKGASNYSITYSTGKLTINKRAITITAKAQSITYGSSILTGTGQVTISGSGLANSNSLTSISLAASRSTVGSGTITPSAAVIKNGTTDLTNKYNITYNTGTLTVTAKALTITAKAQSISFGDSIATGTGQVTVSGLVSGDSLTGITLTASTTAVTTTGTITPSAASTTNGAGNYSITYNTGTLTISKRAITITAKNQTVTFGTAISTGTGQVTTTSLGRLTLSSIVLTQSTTNVTTTGTITPSAAVIKDGTTDVTSSCTITYSEGTLTINKKALTITAKAQSISFGDSIATGTGQVTVSGLVTGDSLTNITLTASTTAVTTTGTITPSAASTTKGASNYNITYNTGTLTISKRTITIKAKNQSVTFGTAISTGTGQVIISSLGRLTLSSITLTQSTTSVTTTGTITPSAAVIKDGTIDVTSSCTITYNTGTLTINRKSLTITAKAQTITYGSSISTSSSQVTVSGLISGDSLTGVTLTASTTNVPGGTITPSNATCTKGISNYNVTYNTGTLTINKRTVTPTAPTATNRDFNNTAQIIFSGGSCTAGGTMYYSASDTTFSTSTWSTSLPYTQKTNAGTYTIYWYCYVSDTANNTGTNINTKNSISATINKVAATLPSTWQGDSKEFHETAVVTVSGYSGGTLKYRYDVNNGTSWTETTTAPTRTAVGDTAVQCMVVADSNHTSTGWSSTITLSIYKADDARMTVTLGSGLTYTGSALTIATASDVHGISSYYIGYKKGSQATADSQVTWNSANTTPLQATTAGDYYVYYKFTVDSSHTGDKAYTYVGKVTINKKSRSGAVSCNNVVYGSTVTASVSGNTENGTVTWGITNGTGTAVINGSSGTVIPTNKGTVTVTASVAATANYAAYTATPKEITISARPINIIAGSKSKVYDGTALTYNSATAEAAGTNRGLSPSGDYLVSCTVTGSITDAGSTNNVPSNARIKNSSEAIVTNNYDITYVNGTLTVTQANGSGSVSMDGWVYGNSETNPTPSSSTNPTSGVTYTWYNSSKTALSAKPTSTSSVGTYYIKATFPANTNYKAYTTDYVSFSITQRKVTLNWGTTSWTYDKSAHSTTCTAGNLVNSDTCTVTLTGNSVGASVGTATVTASSLSNSNYKLPSSKTATLTISARTITLNWGTTSWTYDGNTHSTTCTAGNVVSGDTCTVTLSGNSVGPDVGNATVTASSLSNSNYTLPSSKTATLTINAKFILPPNSIPSVNTTYDGNSHSITFPDVTGATITKYGYSEDQLTWTETTTNPSQTNVGTLYVRAYYSAKANYTGSNWSNSAIITINKASQTAPTASVVGTTYNGTSTASASGGGDSNGVGHNEIQWSNGNSLTAIGTRDTQARWNGNSNYNPSPWSNTVTLSVSKYTPSVILSATNRIYNGSALYATAMVSYPSGGKTPNGTIYYGTSSGATTYSISYSGSSVSLSSVSVTDYNCGSGNSITVYAYFVPDSTCSGVYNNSGNASKTMTITGKANQSAPTATGATTTYPTAATASATGGGGHGSIVWTNGNTRTTGGSQNTQAYWSGDCNYNASPNSNTVTLTVNKTTGWVTGSNTDRTYNGSSQVISTLSGYSGTPYMGFGGSSSSQPSSWSQTTSLSATTAGDYFIWAKCDASDNYNAVSPVYIGSVNIACLYPTITEPTAKTGLVYNGSSQTLYNAGSNTTPGTFTYSNGTRTNAGSQTVSWEFQPTDSVNYFGRNGSFTGTIAKADAIPGTAVNPSTVTFSTSSQTVQLGITDASGTITYPTSISVQEDYGYAVRGWTCTSAGVVTINAGQDASIYTITGTISVAESTNYNSGTAGVSWTVTITKAAGQCFIAVPYNNNAGTYDGNSKTIANISGTGTCYYRVNSGSWIQGTTVTATNAGSYLVEAYCAISTNYNQSSVSSETVTINKKSRTVSWVTAPLSRMTSGQACTIEASVSEGDGTIGYRSSDWNVAHVDIVPGYNVVTAASPGICNIIASIGETTNYQSASISSSLTVVTNYESQYLTFTPVEDSTFSFSQDGLSYSLNNGSTWTTLSANANTPTVTAGNKILWKGAKTSPLSNSGIGKFSSSGVFDVSGNIMSLVYGDNFEDNNTIYNYQFASLFKQTKCRNCSNLILPATTLANNCYQAMFFGCTNLTTATELPATTLAERCYQNMFKSCTSLTTAPTLPATTLAESCYNRMFYNCISLTTAPELPATTLASSCYYFIFYGCTSLNSITCLATNISAGSCTYNWVNGVAASGTFTKAASMTGWTTGIDGIPSGWTIKNYTPEPLSSMAFDDFPAQRFYEDGTFDSLAWENGHYADADEYMSMNNYTIYDLLAIYYGYSSWNEFVDDIYDNYETTNLFHYYGETFEWNGHTYYLYERDQNVLNSDMCYALCPSVYTGESIYDWKDDPETNAFCPYAYLLTKDFQEYRTPDTIEEGGDVLIWSCEY